MKRDRHLIPLSQEHQLGLALARRCSHAAGDEASLRQQWQAVVERFQSELDPHFAAEERWLLPALQAAGETAAVDRTLAEHAQLRRLIAAPPSDPQAQLQALGRQLTAHIRFEERELFELAQRVLDSETLSRIGAALLDH